eukprot:365338-Chlamydomonas_euryale.AAC.44
MSERMHVLVRVSRMTASSSGCMTEPVKADAEVPAETASDAAAKNGKVVESSGAESVPERPSTAADDTDAAKDSIPEAKETAIEELSKDVNGAGHEPAKEDPQAEDADVGDSEDELEIALPGRRRNADDEDEGGDDDEFEDAKSEGAPEAGSISKLYSDPVIAPMPPQESSPTGPGGDAASGASAKWADKDEEDEDAAEDVVEGSSAEGEDSQLAEKDGGEDAEEKKPAPKREKKEPFEVPTQGAFWLHDDRFDETEAAAHDE